MPDFICSECGALWLPNEDALCHACGSNNYEEESLPFVPSPYGGVAKVNNKKGPNVEPYTHPYGRAEG